MKGKEGFGYFKGRKKNQKKCELAKKLRVGLIKRIEILKTKLNANDNKLLQAYMVSSLYTLQPPDRLDYAGMLMVGSRKEIKEKENY